MSVLKASRTAQWPLVATFSFNWDDTMLNVSGVSHDFKTAAAHVFDVIALPPGATVLGGDFTVVTTFATVTTYAVTVGDSASTNRYLGTADYKAAARNALVPTGYVSLGEQVRLAITPTGADATAGRATLCVQYVIANRSNEVQIT